MKKHLLIMAFAFFLLAGSQTMFGQTKLETNGATAQTMEVSAKKNAQNVINMLEREAKLDADQKTKVYDLFYGLEKKFQMIDAIDDPEEKKLKQTKMQAYVNQKLQQVLSQEQYKLYLKKTMKAY